MASKSRAGRARQQGQQRQRPEAQPRPVVAAPGDAAAFAGAEISAPGARRPAVAEGRGAIAAPSQRMTLLAILGLGALIRLALLPFGQMAGDIGQFRLAAGQLLNEAPWDFYDAGPIGFLPGTLLVLWLTTTLFDLVGGSIDGEGFVYLVKSVAAVADIAAAAMIFGIVRRLRGEMAALAAALLVVLNPAVWFVGSVWGQWDSVGAAFALLGLYLYFRGKPEYALAPVAFAALVSLHVAVVALVIVAAFAFRSVLPHTRYADRFRRSPATAATDDDDEDVVVADEPAVEPLPVALRRGGLSLAGALAVLLVVPALLGAGLFGLGDRSLFGLLREQSDLFAYTTVNAFTLWGLLSNNWQPDGETFALGLDYRAWGVILTVVALGGIVAAMAATWRRLGDRVVVWGAFAATLAMFLLPTRGHERYLLPAVIFAALLAGVAPRLLWLYAAISGTYFLNIYWVFALYANPPSIGLFEGDNLLKPISLANVAILALTFGVALPLMLRGGSLALPSWLPGASAIAPPAAYPGGTAPGTRTVQDARLTDRLERARAETASVTRPAWQTWYLPASLALLGFVFFLIRVDLPDDYIYDEVYHAWTAAQYVEGNPNTFDPFATPRRDIIEGRAGFYQGEGRTRACTEEDCTFYYEWTHPPLGKQLIAVGILFFGDEPFGWRFMSTVAGAITLFIVYRLAMALTGRWVVGALAAGLLMIEGLFFVQARTSMLDIFIVLFTTSSLWAFLRYLRLPVGSPARTVFTHLLVTGALMGCAIAVKWNSVYSAGFIGLIAVARLGWVWWKSGQNARRPRPELLADFRNNLVFIPLCLIVLPLSIYFATYSHMFFLGQNVGDWAELQRQMFTYHTEGVADNTHKYMSLWWEWPLALMPVWYGTQPGATVRDTVFESVNPLLVLGSVGGLAALGFQYWRERAVRLGLAIGVGVTVVVTGALVAVALATGGPDGEGTTGYVFANVNPVLSWAMVPASLFVCWVWWKERAVRWAPLLILAVGFFGQWLPWILSPRMAFVYHFLPSAIFGVIAIAIVIDYAWRKRSLEWRIPAVAYPVTALLIFLFLFPIYAALQLDPDGLQIRTWFEGWTVR